MEAKGQRLEMVVKWGRGCGNFSQLCREYGISRKTGYKWLKRYGEGGSKALLERSRRPCTVGGQYAQYWKERLSRARRQRPRWGARKLWTLMKAAHGANRVRLPAASTLARWLRQMKLVNSNGRRRARRGPLLEAGALTLPQAANEVWTVDFKGWFRTGDGQRQEPLTVRDLFSRYVLGIVLLDNQSDALVRRTMSPIFKRHGVPQVIRVDNGSPFGGKGSRGLSRLSLWWLKLGIRVEFTRPATPSENGAHEQMHRILKADTLNPPAASRRAQTRRLRVWISYYNTQRPHESLDQQTPQSFYNTKGPARLMQSGFASHPAHWPTRRVRNRGHIKWQGRLRFVGRAFVGERVGLKELEPHVHEVYISDILIGVLHDLDQGGMRPVRLARRR